jgi:hypothetical protein
MSEPNPPPVGRLLCAIGNAGTHMWGRQSFDVFLYEHGIAAVRVTATETAQAFGSKPATLGPPLGPRPGLAERGSAPIEEMLERNPANRFVPRRDIARARLGRGLIAGSLILTLADGTKVRWVWGGPPSRETVLRALDQMGV